MSSKLNPYINFKGNAKEAMQLYQTVFGGALDMTTYAEGGMSANQGDPEQIMHAQLDADNGMTIMAADTPDGMPYTEGNNVSISLSGDDETGLSEYFNKLAESGTIAEPLTKAPWGDTFGMLTDKFGIHWLVNITGAKSNE